MGSLKFAIGLSLLSYESCRPSLCTSFKFSDGLPVSSLRSPYSVLFEVNFQFIETFWFRTRKLSFGEIFCKLSKECIRAFFGSF